MLVTTSGVIVRGGEFQACQADRVKVRCVLVVRVGQEERPDQAAHGDQWDQNCSESPPCREPAQDSSERGRSGFATSAAHEAQCSVGAAERLRGDRLGRTRSDRDGASAWRVCCSEHGEVQSRGGPAAPDRFRRADRGAVDSGEVWDGGGLRRAVGIGRVP